MHQESSDYAAPDPPSPCVSVFVPIFLYVLHSHSHSLSCFYELAPLKSDEKPSIPVYVMKNMFPVVANAILRICSATCSPTPPNAQSSPLAQFRAALFLLAHCTLHLAPCTTRPILHITRLPPRWSAPTRALYSVQCPPSTQLPSPNFCQLCTAEPWSGRAS